MLKVHAEKMEVKCEKKIRGSSGIVILRKCGMQNPKIADPKLQEETTPKQRGKYKKEIPREKWILS